MDNKQVTKIVAASLLGDGCVKIRPQNNNACFVIAQVEQHKDHLDYLKTHLSQITHIREWTKTNFVNGSGKNPKTQLWLESRAHPQFTTFRERMYPNGHKVVDPHYLTLLDWEFLAIWYMQDGSIQKTTQKYGTYGIITLCTHSFSYGDNHLLRDKLKEKLRLDFNVRSSRGKNGNQYWFLTLRSVDNEVFLDNIKPFVQSSFLYKCPVMIGSKIILDEDVV